MVEIAGLLLAAGGELESWSTDSSDLFQALLWAVQANCPKAVQVLLDLGAKVFPITRPVHRRGRHFSPVHWASRLHQSEILKMLLDNAAKTGIDAAEPLNTAWESMEEGVDEMLPLALASSYPGGFVMPRIMLHGADYIQQCFRTVHMLLNAGAKVDCAVDAVGGSVSILGCLIYEAKSHPGAVKAIGAFLSCVGARNFIFEKFIQMEDSKRTCMNALQFALVYRPRSHVSPGVDILIELTKYFRHPKSHLGAVFGPKCHSLFRMVMDMGNPAAAEFLLKLPGIDAPQRDAYGLTAFDVCITRWANSTRDTSLAFTSAIEDGVPSSKAIEHWDMETD
ncbi:hypothetical protein MFIFM68171_11129 [Madurella fahalii]|uniref:Ankyrin repeat protein n=1 Tax=Madurella fahalii TaxID=1157608 RepID=A0ABQ0GTA2_9PEZI